MNKETRKLHIGMVLDNGDVSFPPDIRVEKEMTALTTSGFMVTVITRANQQKIAGKFRNEQLQGEIVRVNVSKKRSFFEKVKYILTMRSSVWLKPLHDFIQNEKPDVLHVHDLMMLPTVLQVAKGYGIPVIADLHENMPAAKVAARANLPLLKKTIHALKSNYFLMKFNEKKALKQCSRIITVVPEANERLWQYGISQDKVVVVSNTEDETTFSFSREDALVDILDKYQHKWVMSYIGGIGNHRGLDTALKAVPLIKDKIDNFCFLIVGAKPRDEKILKKLINDLNIKDCVDIIGWQPFEKVNSYVMASDVCLVPHNDFEHTQTTIPHKLFQYMICSKPVLVSSCKPLQRVVNDTGSGMVFNANDKYSFMEKIMYMYQHKKELKKMGEKGHDAALKKYAWRNDANVLIDMYQKVE